MGLTMEQRKAVTRQLVARYRAATKKQKGRIQDDYVELTGCSRVYVAWLLRSMGTQVGLRRDGKPVRILVGTRRARRVVSRRYDALTLRALMKLWYLGPSARIW